MRGHRLAAIAVLVVAVMALAGPAFAKGSGEKPPATKPKVHHVGNPSDPKVASERNVLPFTGSDLTLYVLAGGLTVAVGTAMVRRARVRSARL
jgi:hypothetical protein